MAGRATQQEVLGYDIDTERMTIALPAREGDQSRARLTAECPAGRQTATVKEVLALAGKLNHQSFVIRSGRYFVRRLLQLTNLHLSGADRARGGGAWGRYRKQAEARRIVRLSREFMADVGWWRWVLGRGGGYGGENMTAPSFSFVKQLPSRT